MEHEVKRFKITFHIYKLVIGKCMYVKRMHVCAVTMLIIAAHLLLEGQL